MRKLAALCAIVLLAGIILVSCSTSTGELVSKSSSAVTWEQSWNNKCDNANFSDNHQIMTSTTLGDLYEGSDFSFDISKLNILMTAELGYDAGLEGAGQYELYLEYIPGDEIDKE